MSTILNHDIHGLAQRINGFIVELQLSVSSSVHAMNTADQVRLSTYLAAILAYRAWVVSQPQLDLPETHPREYETGPDPETPAVENESIQDLINLMELMRDEMVNSQSARQPSGFLPADNVRLIAIVDKCAHFLNDYIQQVQPVDMPESSPSQPVSGPGAGGV